MTHLAPANKYNREANMPLKLYLYDLTAPALILPLPTGVVYQQQTAGICCLQDEAEGVLLPIPGVFLTDELIHRTSDMEYLEESAAAAIDLSWLILDHSFRMVVDREKLAESREAWVHVKVVLPEYAGRAILTWENSD